MGIEYKEALNTLYNTIFPRIVEFIATIAHEIAHWITYIFGKSLLQTPLSNRCPYHVHPEKFGEAGCHF